MPLADAIDPPSDVVLLWQDRTMRIAIVGTGPVGRTLGDGLAKGGHDVVVDTRDPNRTQARDDWKGVKLQLTSYGDIGASADLFVNATSGANSLEALQAVGAEALAGKVLIDMANPLDHSRGFPPPLLMSNTDSLAEQIQRAFPDAKVVKAFNTVTVALLVNPKALDGEETTIFLAGEDADARATVAGIAADLGWTDVIQFDDLTAARGLEMWMSLWIRLFRLQGTAMFNIKVVR
jgi:8-hydroxy-5-deazaflavin:NADPH oxidoreductase